MRSGLSILLFVFCLSSCTERKRFTVISDFEEPQSTIARTIVDIVNKDQQDSILVRKPTDSLTVTSALESGYADFAIINNYFLPDEKIKTIIPLFNQVLHLLVRDEILIEDNTVRTLLTNRKVYAGEPSSSTRRFVEDLIADYDINPTSVHFVDVLNLFAADVIFSFTDLLSQDELKDLVEYKFYSFDRVSELGKGSLVEGICTRYPEFEPYIISRELYGEFTREPIVTVRLKSVLVGSADVPEENIYQILEALEKNKGKISNLNPMLYKFTTDFDPSHLTFQLHPGAVQYLTRSEPVFIQKYADLLGVIISVVVAIASLSYSFRQWKNAIKKSKIDVFYGKLISISGQILKINKSEEVHVFLAELKSIQEETIHLVIKEKLNADESFLIFLSLSKIIYDDLREKLQELSNISIIE